MAEFIHARRRDGQWRYRMWSSIVDAYISREMDVGQLRECLLDDYSVNQRREGHAERDISKRLERAHATGSSAFVAERVNVDGPWDTERCPKGTFHHAFEPTMGALCRCCGESRSDHAHEPECGKAD